LAQAEGGNSSGPGAMLVRRPAWGCLAAAVTAPVLRGSGVPTSAASSPIGQDWPATSDIEYPPGRLSGMCGQQQLPEDGLATFWLAHVWSGFEHRDDLEDLYELGVRSLMLYRCIVEESSIKRFLDRVWNQGLTVVLELPPRLFVRQPGGCFLEGGTPTFRRFDCYAQVREACRQLLPHVLTDDGTSRYHPAVEMVLLGRHPEAATPGFCPGCGLPEAMRATLTAWDGLMDAENELGVDPEGVRISMMFATAAKAGGPVHELPSCYRFRAPSGGCAGVHTLRGLWLAANWLDNETHVPHNNLSAALVDRWVHAFGASAPKDDIVRTLREYYEFLVPRPARETEAALLEFDAEGDLLSAAGELFNASLA